QQRLDTSESKPDAKLKRGALSGMSRNRHRTLQSFEGRLDHVHANAAARDGSHICSGAQARLKNQIQRLALGEPAGLFRGNNSAPDCLGHDSLTVEAAAILANFDDHLVALMYG